MASHAENTNPINSPLRQWWLSWLSRRLPAQRSVTLAHRSIFILPSGFGLFWLLLVVLLFLFGTNYQNNLVIGLSILLLSIFNTCIIYSYRNLAGMTLEAKTGPNVYAGQSVIYPIVLSAAQIQHNVTLNYHCNPVQTVDRLDEQKQTVLLSFANTMRGLINPGRIKVESRYPLGLCRAWSNVDLDNSQIVFAKPKPSENRLTQHLTHAAEESHQHGKTIIGVEEFKSLKPYVTGESLNQIAWKQLAQGRGMLTKEFEQPLSTPQWLIFDPTSHDIEQQLSELTWMVDQLSQQERVFGVILPSKTIAPSAGAAHRVACLTAIATYPEHVGESHDG